MITLDTIAHIVINVSDIEAAKKWYLTSFSCELTYEDARNVRLRFNNVDLLLCLPSVERHHVAYKKPNAETFGPMVEKSDGRNSCYIADPTGNPVELVKCE